jgi:hypothetical protein
MKMKASLWVLFLRLGIIPIAALSLHTRHPLEDAQSWRLHQRRSLEEEDPNDSEAEQDNEEEEDVETPYKIMHKKLKNHIPFAGGDTTHGMIIDAGSVSGCL